ncbi:MAG: recombinase family protein, partial [Oscillospiraceae bacterium]|nr:recombinase family protein [Oscillospiraceae bacterium]
PKFQELIRDIEAGLIRRVIVYKLDRISRSIIDFAKMMELFQRYNVEFVSSTEKFDTSTPMGRAMLNICIVFAQLERETIQKRVTDAYYSRCQKGFFMSGVAPYGYRLEPYIMDGIRTKRLVIESEAAEQVKLMYEMYADPQTSLGDIARYFHDEGIDVGGRKLYRSALSALLKNPAYAQADLDVYEFMKSQGANVVNDAADFAGTNGCYLFQGQNATATKNSNLKDQIVVVAPHEGLVPSETWLAVRKRLMNNTTFTPNSRKPKNTWLSGKIKCGRCGTALMYAKSPSSANAYFRCRKYADNGSCEGCGTLRVGEIEHFIYDEMAQKLREFHTLTGGNPVKANPKLTAYHVELAQVEAEIEKLLDTLTGANAVLMSYANTKIEELDAQRQSLMKAIADMTADTFSPNQLDRISDYIGDWENIAFEEKQVVIDGLISQIRATSESFDIVWKF